jgi:hypothetical protein
VVHAQARSFYIPTLNPAHLAEDSAADLAPEKTLLHLPSSLLPRARERLCRPGVIEAEVALCLNAMGDALADLIRHLQARMFVLRFKVQNMTGVRANTRAQDGIAGISRRVDVSAAAYRRHRKAYKLLVGPEPTGWEARYKPLSATDVRGLSEKAITSYELEERSCTQELAQALSKVLQSGSSAAASQLLAAKSNLDLAIAQASAADGLADNNDNNDDNDDVQAEPVDMASTRLAEAVAPGEGKRKVSWIWLAGLGREDLSDPQLSDGESSGGSCPVAVSGLHLPPGLRVEWARAKARKECWTKEAILNMEEMRRNIAFSQWQRMQWLDIAAALRDDDPVALEGKRAYALEHADYELRLTRHCVAKWQPVVARARASTLLKDHVVNPFTGVAIDDPTLASLSKGKARATANGESTAKDANPRTSMLELAVGDSEGLAMSTNDGEFCVPRCVHYATRDGDCTNYASIQLDVSCDPHRP